MERPWNKQGTCNPDIEDKQLIAELKRLTQYKIDSDEYNQA